MIDQQTKDRESLIDSRWQFTEEQISAEQRKLNAIRLDGYLMGVFTGLCIGIGMLLIGIALA